MLPTVALGALPQGSAPDALWDETEPWGPVVVKSLEVRLQNFAWDDAAAEGSQDGFATRLSR